MSILSFQELLNKSILENLKICQIAEIEEARLAETETSAIREQVAHNLTAMKNAIKQFLYFSALGLSIKRKIKRTNRFLKVSPPINDTYLSQSNNDTNMCLCQHIFVSFDTM